MKFIKADLQRCFVNSSNFYPPSIGVVGSVLMSVRRFFGSVFCFFCKTGPSNVNDCQEEKSCVPKQAVRGVTTAIKKGETYALLGANGVYTKIV